MTREEMLKEAQVMCNATLQQAQVVRDKAIEPFWQEYYSVVIVANQKYERAIAAYDAAHAPERPGQEAQNLADARACGHGDQDDQT